MAPALTKVDLDGVVPVALDIGWTMAVLFGFIRDNPDQSAYQLPTEHELSEVDRVSVELARLRSLLTRLASALPVSGPVLDSSVSDLEAAWAKPPEGLTPKHALQAVLRERNLAYLRTFAGIDHCLSLAYQVGRSLRDTANPPVRGERTNADILDALEAQLRRARVAKLQEWLATLAPHLNDAPAAVVSASIGRWSDFGYTVFDDSAPGALKGNNVSAKEALAPTVVQYLLDQGDVWRNLLVGAESTEGLLTPEAYVAAGEAALSRTVRIVKRVLLHYWVALAVLAVALAAIMYVASRYLGGAAKVWTQIAAIAGALGVTAKGIGTSVAHLSEAAERPIFRKEEIDGMAWAITTLPSVKVTNGGVRALRRSGIERSAPLGRV
ncbi:MAG TPA: hypothetical protein VHZ02_11245 [Acidimicrobiales bacterium]|nr:hypothetical protein [Acidimicrobiales bacterium]